MPKPVSCSREEGPDFLARASARCESNGALLTDIRRDVLRLLHENENGLKAYDILARIKESRANATPPTVYRALDFLMAQGLVHRIARLNQFVACRHDSHEFPGVFMVCQRCGKVSELHDQPLMKMLSATVQRAGHRLECDEIEIPSVCPDCS